MNIPELPTSIRVAAYDIALLVWPPLAAASAKRYGEFSSMELCIRIDPGHFPVKVLDTVLHEVNHAIFWAYGIEAQCDNEERLCGMLATAWTQIYRDNPALVRWIMDIIGSCA